MPNKYSIPEDKSKYYLVIILKKMKYIFVYPLKNKYEAHKGSQNFFTNIGIPPKDVGNPWGETMRENGTQL